MKKFFFSFVVLSISLTSIQAQLLWKVTGHGLKHPSYLFGTHHLIPISFLDSVPGLYKAFNSCDEVVGEIALNNSDAVGKIQRAAVMPDKKTLRELIPDSADYNMVDKELKRVLKFGLKDVPVINPSLLLSMYEVALFQKATGYNDDTRSDSYFQTVAAEKGKKVVGLETVEQQIALLFGNGSLQRQASLLVETVRAKGVELQQMLELNKLYKEGKLNDLLIMALHKGDLTDMTQQEFTAMVDNRNASWAEQLPDLMHKSTCFIAVGALHLPGQNGVIELLRKKGFRVTPVRSDKDDE